MSRWRNQARQSQQAAQRGAMREQVGYEGRKSGSKVPPAVRKAKRRKKS